MSTLRVPNSPKPTELTATGYLMIVAIGVVACLPLYLYGLPLLLHLNHHYRTALGFFESIANGNYYPSSEHKWWLWRSQREVLSTRALFFAVHVSADHTRLVFGEPTYGYVPDNHRRIRNVSLGPIALGTTP